MSKPLAIGDKVKYRLYNTVDRNFFGDVQVGTIVAISEPLSNPLAIDPDGLEFWLLGNKRMYEVTTPDNLKQTLSDYPNTINLRRKEIIKRLEE